MSARRAWIAVVIAGAVLVFLAGSLLVVYTAAPADGVAVFAGNRIAVLPVEGLISDDQRLIRQLREFRRDGSVKGVVLYLDSPGGEVAPSQSLYRELVRAREDGYPVVASIGSLGTSGAYYAALGADSILALPGSITGSIGVLMEFPDVQELLDKVGVRFEVVKSAEHKDIGSPFRDLTESERGLLQGVVDDVYDQFVDVIVEERGLARDSILKIADGRLLSGRIAREYGLIDAEGNLVDAIAMAGRMAGLGPDPRVVLPRERRISWMDLLARAASWVAVGSSVPGEIGQLISDRVINGTPRLLYVFRH
jgi:protease-4